MRQGQIRKYVDTKAIVKSSEAVSKNITRLLRDGTLLKILYPLWEEIEAATAAAKGRDELAVMAARSTFDWWEKLHPSEQYPLAFVEI